MFRSDLLLFCSNFKSHSTPDFPFFIHFIPLFLSYGWRRFDKDYSIFKMPFEEPLAYKVEWFDSTSGLHRNFNLSFFESDKSVEMVDLKSRKMFLRRCTVSGVEKKDLYVGNTVVIFSRHLLIEDYANAYTKENSENDQETTFVMLYPEAHHELGHVINCFERAGFSLVRIRSMQFSKITAREFLDRFFIKGIDINNDVDKLVR